MLARKLVLSHSTSHLSDIDLIYVDYGWMRILLMREQSSHAPDESLIALSHNILQVVLHNSGTFSPASLWTCVRSGRIFFSFGQLVQMPKCSHGLARGQCSSDELNIGGKTVQNRSGKKRSLFNHTWWQRSGYFCAERISSAPESEIRGARRSLDPISMSHL